MLSLPRTALRNWLRVFRGLAGKAEGDFAAVNAPNATSLAKRPTIYVPVDVDTRKDLKILPVPGDPVKIDDKK